MNPVAVTFAVLGLVTLAAAGVLAGYLREAPEPLEPLADPLEDRREALLRSLADLEEARATGALEAAEHERLQEETEARLARVVDAIERRAARHAPTGDDGSDAPTADVRTAVAAAAAPEPRRIPPWAVGVLLTGTVLAVVVASLVRDAEPQRAAATAPAGDGLAFFEQRVERHPDDLAARLDLAHRYLDAGRIEEALEHYGVALELDPDDAEANAHVGMILYLAERPKEALAAVDRALATDPDYPEALFFRGVILLRGLDRPQEAIDALERYLAAAPFGAERGTAQELIAEAERALSQT